MAARLAESMVELTVVMLDVSKAGSWAVPWAFLRVGLMAGSMVVKWVVSMALEVVEKWVVLMVWLQVELTGGDWDVLTVEKLDDEMVVESDDE